jgi:hypothetical protein
VLRLFFALSILVPIPAIANSIPFPNLPDPTPACRVVFGTPNLLPYYNKCINDEQTSHDLLKGVGIGCRRTRLKHALRPSPVGLDPSYGSNGRG